MSLRLFNAFAVPMASIEMPHAAPLNRELRELFLAREAEGMRYRNPHPSMTIPDGLFESDFNLFAWTDPPVLKLRDFCWRALSHFVADLNGYSQQDLSRIVIQSHTWFHITRKGGYFGMHNHAMASWSGVYCVDPGGDAPGHPESGMLRFHCPHQLANMYTDAGNARLRQPYGMGSFNLKHQAGSLVLFPSWLIHEVLPFHGEGERITVAFNCWFKGA